MCAAFTKPAISPWGVLGAVRDLGADGGRARARANIAAPAAADRNPPTQKPAASSQPPPSSPRASAHLILHPLPPGNQLVDFPNADKLPAAELLAVPCDVLMPAAIGGVITGELRRWWCCGGWRWLMVTE